MLFPHERVPGCYGPAIKLATCYIAGNVDVHIIHVYIYTYIYTHTQDTSVTLNKFEKKKNVFEEITALGYFILMIVSHA